MDELGEQDCFLNDADALGASSAHGNDLKRPSSACRADPPAWRRPAPPAARNAPSLWKLAQPCAAQRWPLTHDSRSRRYLEDKGATVKTAALYTMPQSELRADFSLREVDTVVPFPWEQAAPAQ